MQSSRKLSDLATPRVVVTDIEGTTTSIAFVHDVLFPYSREFLPRFVETYKARPDVAAALADAAATVKAETGKAPVGDEITHALLGWIAADRKHPALKALQGMIWDDGYKTGAFHGHVYDDAAAGLKRWRQQGIRLAVYSSGSVAAQILLFRYSDHGDLSSLFSDNYDTAVGAKREASSYARIVEDLRTKGAVREPAEVLFLSDIEGELDAAAQAGMAAVQIVRAGTRASARHLGASSFDELRF